MKALYFSVVSFRGSFCFGHALLDPCFLYLGFRHTPSSGIRSLLETEHHYAKCLACFVNSLRWKPAGLHRVLRRNTRYYLIQPDFLNKWHSSGESVSLDWVQVRYWNISRHLSKGPWICVYLNHLAVHLKTNTILSINSNIK